MVLRVTEQSSICVTNSQLVELNDIVCQHPKSPYVILIHILHWWTAHKIMVESIISMGRGSLEEYPHLKPPLLSLDFGNLFFFPSYVFSFIVSIFLRLFWSITDLKFFLWQWKFWNREIKVLLIWESDNCVKVPEKHGS